MYEWRCWSLRMELDVREDSMREAMAGWGSLREREVVD